MDYLFFEIHMYFIILCFAQRINKYDLFEKYFKFKLKMPGHKY